MKMGYILMCRSVSSEPMPIPILIPHIYEEFFSVAEKH